ncbi:heavy-metal-associated domain-containing protein [Pengzhenrongella sicca]|uniref:Heavy-metal-associated domain-containing protein n=1 Tax=Pengzhenrongella sicca TaxID=2819238 RepID=A0A8A4ZI12_9MICO|nr:cation transporter [Pengzhenrongella sicca]QTE30167.1 heavy-metal-associated domain-containing protein [Pengzhenrongella sicca]
MSAETTTNYTVAGMTCGHCVAAVSAEVGKIAGVRSVEIDLVAGGTSAVRVASEAELAVDDVRAAVDEAGYELTGVSA